MTYPHKTYAVSVCASCEDGLHSRCSGDMAKACICTTCWQWSQDHGPFADACPDACGVTSEEETK